jgi:hypothetical protein
MNGATPIGPSPKSSTLGLVGRTVAILGLAIFLVALVWFAHLSFSLTAYVESTLTMLVGALLGITASGRWGDIFLSIKEYFRGRLR